MGAAAWPGRAPTRRGGSRASPSRSWGSGDGQDWAPPPGSIPTMPIPSLDGVRSVHLVGIGGAGMRNLARLLVARGADVRGSDLKDGASLDELRGLGVTVWIGHDAAHLARSAHPTWS